MQNFPQRGRGLSPVTHKMFGIRSNVSSKLLELETSNLVHSFLLEKPSGRSNNFPRKGRGLGHCHGRSDGPTFSVAEHPVFYNFATLWAFIAPTSSRFVAVQLCYVGQRSQLGSLAPVRLGSPARSCKLPSRSRDVIVCESSELKKRN